MFNSSIFKILIAGVSFFLFATPIQTAQAAETPEIPAEIFAKLPTMSQFGLSPKGTHYAYLSSLNGKMHLVIQPLGGDDPKVIPPMKGSSIFTYWWATNERLLVGIETHSTARGVGLITTETRLLGIDITLENIKWLVKSSTKSVLGSRSKREKLSPPQIQTQIVDLLPNEPDFILLSVDGNHDAKDEVRKINIHTGDYKEIVPGRRGIQNWYTDQQGQISFGNGYDISTWYASLRMPNGKWNNVSKLKAFDNYSFYSFTDNNQIVYVTGASQYGTTGLYLMDLNSGKIIETVFEHEKVDIDGVLKHPRSGNVIGVYYTLDFPIYEYFDPTFSKIQKMSQKALKDPNIKVVDKVQGKEQYILYSANDREPGVYYWYDVTAKQLSFLSPVRPEVDPALMASVKPVSIPVSDGSHIPGYLTLPIGVEAKNLPTIIYPHGGPGARDTANWDYTAQFLANRGYAVLQPNFRGSDGYGYEFRSKGKKQWGGLMQKDVTDATNWMIEQGITDKSRICIIGASYGGYSALMGVIQEPDLYQCAASTNGVTDIPRMISNDKKFIGGRSWTKNMGLEGSNGKDVSPYHQASRVSAPVLIMSSKDDTSIDYDWSEDFHKKLKKLKKDSTYVLIEDGGHSMDTENARLTKLTNLEKFLAKHIGN